MRDIRRYHDADMPKKPARQDPNQSNEHCILPASRQHIAFARTGVNKTYALGCCELSRASPTCPSPATTIQIETTFMIKVRANEIVRRIRHAIESYKLTPGTKLGEQSLCEIFAANRTIVREALQDLAREGLVTIEYGRGAFVATPSRDDETTRKRCHRA